MDRLLTLYVADLLTKTPRIKVVREVRALTGFSLDTAKRFCDAVEGRGFLREQIAPEFGGGSLVARIRLLQDGPGGDSPAAVRLVREETGMTDSEARRFLTSLDRDPG